MIWKLSEIAEIKKELGAVGSKPASNNFQIIYNRHNHEIVNGDSVALCNSIKSDIDLCASDPIYANLFLAGDFNLTSTQGRAYSFSDPIPVAIVEAG